MNNHQIFWPMLLQIILPMLVLLVMAKRKAADIKSGAVDPKKTAVDSKAWGDGVVLTSNNLANQFQIPVLFYALCLMAYLMNAASGALLGVAWFFVVSRYAHALIHITTNHVPHRFPAFMLGVLAVWVMIVMLGLKLAGM